MRDAAIVITIIAAFLALNVVFLANPEQFIQTDITGKAFTNVVLNNPANGAEINVSEIAINLTSLYDTNCSLNGTRMATTGGTEHIQNLNGLADGAYEYQIDCGVLNGSSETETLTFTINTTVPPVCGNNVIEIGEQCDNGTNNGAVCSAAYGTNCTYCNATCTIITVSGGWCGDGGKNGAEECEWDNNCFNGEKCNKTTCACYVPNGWSICGNGVKETSEECDDRNNANTDGCTNSCESAVCGDGYIRNNYEDCEDDRDCSSGQKCNDCQCETVQQNTQQTTPVTESPAPVCANYWVCTDWQPNPCQPWDRQQTRACINTYTPSCNYGRPNQTQTCLYTPTCDDMIKNQGELGIDCGGPCSPCRIINYAGGNASVDKYMDEINATRQEFDKRLGRTSFLLSIVPVMVVGLYFFLRYKFPQQIGYNEENLQEVKQILREPIKKAMGEGYTRQAVLQLLVKKQWERGLVEEVLDDFYPKKSNTLNSYVGKALSKGQTKKEIKKALIKNGWPEKTIDEELKRAS